MNLFLFLTISIQFLFATSQSVATSDSIDSRKDKPKSAFTGAADFGFLPTETGVNNAKSLQAAVDKGGPLSQLK